MLRGERSIQIVGENTLQNRLLSAFLKDAVGADCACKTRLEEVARSEESVSCERLILIDCFGMQREQLASMVESDCMGQLRALRPTLFNLHAETSIEQGAIRCGVRGFFYIGDSLAVFAKGIVALFNDEYWVSRKLLVDILLAPNLGGNFVTHYPWLTLRESELIGLLTKGLSNQAIADLLFISVPTVKTHLSSIYRKLNVANRLQAVCWAEKAVLGVAPPEE